MLYIHWESENVCAISVFYLNIYRTAGLCWVATTSLARYINAKLTFWLDYLASLYPIGYHFHPVHLKLCRVAWENFIYILSRPLPLPHALSFPLLFSKLIKSSHSHIVLLFYDTVYFVWHTFRILIVMDVLRRLWVRWHNPLFVHQRVYVWFGRVVQSDHQTLQSFKQNFVYINMHGNDFIYLFRGAH